MMLELPSLSIDKEEVVRKLKLNLKTSGDGYQFRTKFEISKGGEFKPIDLICHHLEINILKLSIHMKGIEILQDESKLHYDLELKFSVGKFQPTLKGYVGTSNVDTVLINGNKVKQFLELFVQ